MFTVSFSRKVCVHCELLKTVLHLLRVIRERFALTKDSVFFFLMLADGEGEDGGGVDISSSRYLALYWYESPMKRLQFSGKKRRGGGDNSNVDCRMMLKESRNYLTIWGRDMVQLVK